MADTIAVEQADVLIVAGAQDIVASRLEAALGSCGRRACLLDGPTAARLFTVRVNHTESVVTPNVAVFARASAWWGPGGADRADADGRFLHHECLATFWAAAALLTRPVINRPAANGFVHRLNAGLLTEGLSGREVHVSGSDQIADLSEAWWAQDAQYRIAPASSFEPQIPLRAREITPEAGYEIVTVVTDEAFVATHDERSKKQDLAARSIALTLRAGVQFATVTWEVGHETAVPILLNPDPDGDDLRYRMPDVIEALCRSLSK